MGQLPCKFLKYLFTGKSKPRLGTFEMDKSRKRNGHNNDLYSELEESKSEIKILKDIIDFMEKDEEKIYRKLELENRKLKLQIQNLLKCDVCEKQFDDKASLKMHNLANHSRRSFKCNICGEGFSVKGAMTRHNTEHHRKVKKDKLLEKMNALDMQINIQKQDIFNAILQLKKKENKENGACYSKGRFCPINHSRFRWTVTKSDSFLDKLNYQKKMYLCHKCDIKFEDNNDAVSHMKTVHPRIFKCKQCHKRFREEVNMKNHAENEHEVKFLCQECSKTFESNQELRSHVTTVHSNNSLKEDGSNESSILKSFESGSEEMLSHDANYECNICDGEFIDAETLNHHNETYHKTSPHEMTFFNPSAN